MPRVKAKLLPDGSYAFDPGTVNKDHIETLNDGQSNEVWIDFEFADVRKIRPQQRKLFFALLNDIMVWSVTPKDFLKDLFYNQYSIMYDGKEISLSNQSQCSVTDGNNLLDLVIDFMFEWNVPFKEGYKLLPRNEEYYLFECCRHRVCCVCGKPAIVHHVEGSRVGIGGDRTKVDHTKRHVLALCEHHHDLIHTMPESEFGRLFHIPVDGVELDFKTLKRIGVRGDYSAYQNNERGTAAG